MALSKNSPLILFDRYIDPPRDSRAIDKAINRLQARHQKHISVYGRGNERRLTGRHETANVSDQRNAIRIFEKACHSS